MGGGVCLRLCVWVGGCGSGGEGWGVFAARAREGTAEVGGARCYPAGPLLGLLSQIPASAEPLIHKLGILSTADFSRPEGAGAMLCWPAIKHRFLS